MKEFNGVVRVGETADIEKAVEMPFSEVLKLPSFKGEGRGRKPIYNFICFAFGFGEKDYKYYNKVFIKECMESWKRKFPLSRYIFINVEDCLELSLWTEISFSLISYPTDSLRLYFVSLLDNCFYLDADVYLSEDVKLPTKENDFVIKYSGNCTWNKKRNNKNIQELFEYYENKLLNKLIHHDNFSKALVNDFADSVIFASEYVKDKIKNIDEDKVCHLEYICDFLEKKYILILNQKNKQVPNFDFDGDLFWAVISIAFEKCMDYSDKFLLYTNNNRFYVKLENNTPTGISFVKKDGYNISYSNRLFWDWVKHYINNGMYKNIKLEDEKFKIIRTAPKLHPNN